jgi:DNA-binding response OmpR family regulator
MVIMMTANSGRRHQAYAESLGVDAYLLKPFGMERLLDKAAELLRQRASELGQSDLDPSGSGPSNSGSPGSGAAPTGASGWSAEGSGQGDRPA